MNYKFPRITHIDQVRKAIADAPHFIIVTKDGYQVVNYVVSGNETFPSITDEDSIIRRECRGMIFDLEGNVLARRLHKFFNLGEREEVFVENIDFTQPHSVLMKMDGSMITPFRVNGRTIWGTKMGDTDVAIPVQEYVASRPEYQFIADVCANVNTTPIFEWCSRKQRIVLDYKQDQLILLAVRHNVTGEYMTYEAMAELAWVCEVPVVEAFGSEIDDIDTFVEMLSTKEDIEGVVIRFENGHMVKVKTEWYVLIHRAKDFITREHDVVQAILEDKFDDLLPLLPEEDKVMLNNFFDKLNKIVDRISDQLYTDANDMKTVFGTKKAFALSPEQNVNRSWVFSIWDNCTQANARETVVKYLKAHSTKMFAYARMKEEMLSDLPALKGEAF